MEKFDKDNQYFAIRQDNELKILFFISFRTVLRECGETLLGFSDPAEDVNVDADYVLNIFEKQGYWAGLRYNIFFDYENGFEYEERSFGR